MKNLAATGHDSRIDLRWDAAAGATGFYVYRADSEGGPFAKLNEEPHRPQVYSDFFGENDRTYR